MKKLLLSLGTVAAIAAPVASVIACGQTKDAAKTTTAPIKASVLNANAALKALGAKDASYTSTINIVAHTGTLTLDFTTTTAGSLDAVTIAANTKVTILFTVEGKAPVLKINNKVIGMSDDADQITTFISKLASTLTSTKTLAQMQTASVTHPKTVAEVATAFGITLPSGVDVTQKIDSINFSSVDPKDITLEIDFPNVSQKQPLSFTLTPKK